jgi:parallel beta-helix repeat protein
MTACGRLALPKLTETLGFCSPRLASFSRIDRLVPCMNKLFSAVLGAAILWVDSSSGQTVINSAPYTISAAGNYVVGSNLTYSSSTGGAIVIQHHHVTLDLGGHYIFNPVASNSSVGIYVQNAENITIRNGIIVGFNYGVYFNYLGGTKLNSGNIVSDLKLSDNLDGIFLVGATVSKVTNNQITNSNGVGGTGIYIAGGSNVAGGNIINGFSAGIATFGNSYLFENTISNCNTGLFMQGSDKYRFNTTFSCNIPFSGGTVLTSDNN